MWLTAVIALLIGHTVTWHHLIYLFPLVLTVPSGDWIITDYRWIRIRDFLEIGMSETFLSKRLKVGHYVYSWKMWQKWPFRDLIPRISKIFEFWFIFCWTIGLKILNFVPDLENRPKCDFRVTIFVLISFWPCDFQQWKKCIFPLSLESSLRLTQVLPDSPDSGRVQIGKDQTPSLWRFSPVDLDIVSNLIYNRG